MGARRTAGLANPANTIMADARLALHTVDLAIFIEVTELLACAPGLLDRECAIHHYKAIGGEPAERRGEPSGASPARL